MIFKMSTVKDLREAILQQTARVRNLKRKPEIEEATKELVSVKAKFKRVALRDFSDVREEGPILLTSNNVDGREVLPQLRERLRELRAGNFIR